MTFLLVKAWLAATAVIWLGAAVVGTVRVLRDYAQMEDLHLEETA